MSKDSVAERARVPDGAKKEPGSWSTERMLEKGARWGCRGSQEIGTLTGFVCPVVIWGRALHIFSINPLFVIYMLNNCLYSCHLNLCIIYIALNKFQNYYIIRFVSLLLSEIISFTPCLKRLFPHSLQIYDHLSKSKTFFLSYTPQLIISWWKIQ